MTWFLFCYWYEPDAPRDPVGLVRMWTLADALTRVGDRVTLFPPRYRSALRRRVCTVVPIRLIHLRWLRPISYALFSFIQGLMRAMLGRPDVVYYRWMDSPHALVLAKLLGVPCVCEVNGEPVPEWLDDRTRVVQSLKRLLARLALRHCDRIVVLTHRPLFDLMPQWDWATRDGAQAVELLMPFENVTVFYGHIHQEHHHRTGRIVHHAAKSLIYPLPPPGSLPKKAPVAWDPARPYAGLGFRTVDAAAAGDDYSLTEWPVIQG